MTYQDLKAALDCFRLDQRATLRQIKARHRELVKQHHPDRGGDGDRETIRRVNLAYEILLEYCENYRFCFSEEEFFEQVPAERLRRQFGWDPLWGGSKEEDS